MSLCDFREVTFLLGVQFPYLENESLRLSFSTRKILIGWYRVIAKKKKKIRRQNSAHIHCRNLPLETIMEQNNIAGQHSKWNLTVKWIIILVTLIRKWPKCINNSKHLYTIYYVPGTVLSTSHASTPLILSKTLWDSTIIFTILQI